MTTINEAKKLLQEYFIEKWDGRTPISYDNANDKLAETNKPWVRISVRTTAGGQESLGSPGNRMFRRQGFMYFQIFTRSGTKTETSDKLVQDILDIFDGVTVENILIRSGSPTYTGNDGKWYQQNVQFRIIFDEFK
ncbi:MAG: hypothetical protein NC124_02340 [Clostridium sp.]|nr:hypothetical protein [Clostridium sp.]